MSDDKRLKDIASLDKPAIAGFLMGLSVRYWECARTAVKFEAMIRAKDVKALRTDVWDLVARTDLERLHWLVEIRTTGEMNVQGQKVLDAIIMMKKDQA